MEIEKRKLELYYGSFVDSIAGAAGGLISQLLLYPLENFRTRAQMHDQDLSLFAILQIILHTEGIMALYKGLQIALIGSVLNSAIYFWWYRQFKSIVVVLNGGNEDFCTLELVLITAAAGTISSIFCNPFWMINTRMTLEKEKSKSVFMTAKIIYKSEGISAFFKGVLPNLILVTNPIIYFVVYE